MLKKIMFVMLLGILLTLLIVPKSLPAVESALGAKGDYYGQDACYCGCGDNCVCVFMKPQV